MTITPTKIPFPEVIDSTMRAAFVSCPQKFFREFMQGYVPEGVSDHLHAGLAFAAGVEETLGSFHEHNLPSEQALMNGIIELIKRYGNFTPPDPNSVKTFDRMLGALVDYFNEYPLGTDYLIPIRTPIKRGIEFTFAHPIGLRHPETDQPLLYAGRFDRIARWNDMLVVSDDKTASQLGASWAKQWRLRGQFTGYVWGARQFDLDVQGIVIRGISILKGGYGHVQVIEQRPQWEIDRWYDQLLFDIRRMIACWKAGYWDFNLDKSCSDFGGCPFLHVCSSPQPDKWLEIGFTKRLYTPLRNHDGATLP